MRDDQASLTATAVALARVAHAPALASRVLLPTGAAELAALWAAPGLGKPLRLMAKLLSGGLVDHLRLRTAAIDVAVEAAIAAGATQVVLLGAGLDARAHRLPGLGEVTVWEIDHPATQGQKRRRARRLTPRAAAVRYVPVDFSVDDLQERLDAAGLPAAEPSVWVWEGVTMYLPPAATRATLAAIDALSPPGSVLAMTYMQPQLLRGEAAQAAALRLFARLGEPLIGGMSAETAGALIAATGWSTEADTGVRDWTAAHGGHWLASAMFGSERLLVARK